MILLPHLLDLRFPHLLADLSLRRTNQLLIGDSNNRLLNAQQCLVEGDPGLNSADVLGQHETRLGVSRTPADPVGQ